MNEKKNGNMSAFFSQHNKVIEETGKLSSPADTSCAESQKAEEQLTQHDRVSEDTAKLDGSTDTFCATLYPAKRLRGL